MTDPAAWRPSNDAELDELARITPEDVDDAMRTARERAPELARFLEATAERPPDPTRDLAD